MGRFRKIDPRIWNDAKFRDLPDAGKLVFFMLLTHPNMTALGAMRASLSGLAEELDWEPKAFREAFQEAISKGMVEHDPKACLIALPNFLRYNQPESPNVIKAWIGALDLLPECELKNRVIAGAKAFTDVLPEAFRKALPEAFAKGMPYQEPEPEPKLEPPTRTPLPPKGEKRRRAKADRLAPYSSDVKGLVSHLQELWPTTRSDGSPVQNDVVDAASHVERILTEHPEIAITDLKAAALAYLADPPPFPNAIQFWFGPGKRGGSEPPWRRAVRALITNTVGS